MIAENHMHNLYMKKHFALKLPLLSPVAFAVAAILAGEIYSSAQVAPDRQRLPDYDKRAEQKIAGAAVSPEKKDALARLRAKVPGLEMERDSFLGSPKFIHSRDGFLSGPKGEGKGISSASAQSIPADDPHKAIKAFLNEHSALFGHGAEILNNARIKRDYVDVHNGLRTVVWQQEANGIPVFEQVLKGHVTKDGELVNISSLFLPEVEKAAEKGTPRRAQALADPFISAAEALARAATCVGDVTTVKDVDDRAPAEKTPEKLQRLKAPTLKGDAHARLTWFAVDQTQLRLCWEIILTSRSRSEMFQVLVDAGNGEPLLRRCLTEYISDGFSQRMDQ
jgi:hypothetical protein